MGSWPTWPSGSAARSGPRTRPTWPHRCTTRSRCCPRTPTTTAAADLKPSRRWVLAALRAGGPMQTGGPAGGPHRRRRPPAQGPHHPRSPQRPGSGRAGRRHRPGGRAGPLLVTRRPRQPPGRRCGRRRPVSAARHPAGGPREPREREVARGHLAPSGKDPAHPANPARPFRGAGSRAGSGGLAAPAAARPAGGRPALAGFRGGDGRAAGPTAPRSPEAPGGRVVRCRRRAGSPPKDRTALTCRPVTLSNENAPSRFRACPHPHPPACGPQRAAYGPGQGSQGGCPPLH